MPEYRRHRVQGGTYFFTIALNNRRSTLLTDHIDLLRVSVRRARHLRPFNIDAWVVLPEHMHTLWTLPESDDDYRSRIQTIKLLFSRGIAKSEPLSSSRQKRGERGIWQRRFWEHTIRDERDYAAHVDYIHFNPVKHGLVPYPADWPYSTFRKCVANGLYPADWAGPAQT